MGKGRKGKRQVRLDAAVAALQRRYGPGAVVKGATPAAGAAVPHIATGFPALDQALAIGGLPRGRLCDLVGPATSGKTTLALKFLAQAQAGGGEVAYVDQSLSFDADYAHRCGLDLARLWVGTTHDLAEALAAVEALVRNGGLAAVVLDILDLPWADPPVARHLAATLDRLPAALTRSGTALLVLHESPVPALAQHAAVRLQLYRERWIVRHGDVRGYEARVEIVYNRLGPAGRTVRLTIEFNGTVRGDGL